VRNCGGQRKNLLYKGELMARERLTEVLSFRIKLSHYNLLEDLANEKDMDPNEFAREILINAITRRTLFAEKRKENSEAGTNESET